MFITCLEPRREKSKSRCISQSSSEEQNQQGGWEEGEKREGGGEGEEKEREFLRSTYTIRTG